MNNRGKNIQSSGPTDEVHSDSTLASQSTPTSIVDPESPGGRPRDKRVKQINVDTTTPGVKGRPPVDSYSESRVSDGCQRKVHRGVSVKRCACKRKKSRSILRRETKRKDVGRSLYTENAPSTLIWSGWVTLEGKRNIVLH